MVFDHYAVMGNPIKHSLSPLIFSLFAKRARHAITYEKILVPVDGFKDAVHRFQQQGGKGFNVTLPFKEEAFLLCDEVSERAALAGAVNVIKCGDDGSLSGDNTDGVGLVNDLRNKQINLAGKRLLLLGAGGAVRGVLGSLLAEKPRTIVIANRDLAKASTIAKAYSVSGDVSVSAYESLINYQFDLIINGTSASLAGTVPPIPQGIMQHKIIAYDMAYSDKLTPFLEWAKQFGVQSAFDGKGMLYEQAAESFYWWRGVRF